MLGLCAALAWLPSCGETEAQDPPWPAGVGMVARAASLDRLLARLETLERTPLADRARDWRRALPDCETVAARGASPADLFGALACGTAAVGPALTQLDRERGPRDLAFAWRGKAAPP